MTKALKMHDFITDLYDGLCDWPTVNEYYGQTNFLNFGYWDRDTRSQKEACENLMEQLLARISDQSGSILDVACGKGETTAYLSRYFSADQVVGINIAEKQLEVARKNLPECEFVKMSATDMAFEDGRFDNIISVEAAFHFYTRQKFLLEAQRVLKPGGRLVLSDVLMTLEAERDYESHTEENYLENLDAYRELLESIGFVDVQVEDVTQECWIAHFWYAIRYFNQEYLDAKITREQLERRLNLTYRRVPNMKYYLLASCSKA